MDYIKGKLPIHRYIQSVVRLNEPTCFRRRPNIRYIAISAHDAAFPVTSPGILATLIPQFVAASISTPSYKHTYTEVINFSSRYYERQIENTSKSTHQIPKAPTLQQMNNIMTKTFQANTKLHYKLHLICTG